MFLLGDTHGIAEIPGIIRKLKREVADEKAHVLCVGDVGIGFYGVGQNPSLSKRFKYIRGNHDNPYWAKKHPQFAIDYGMWNGMFLIGGARSVDIEDRTEGVNWWRDEQLGHRELLEAVELYREAKPDIVVSHDCPFSIARQMLEIQKAVDPEAGERWGVQSPYPAILAMDEMLSIHRPKHWFFGHWHLPAEFEVEGTMFRCLGICELTEVPEI